MCLGLGGRAKRQGVRVRCSGACTDVVNAHACWRDETHYQGVINGPHHLVVVFRNGLCNHVCKIFFVYHEDGIVLKSPTSRLGVKNPMGMRP